MSHEPPAMGLLGADPFMRGLAEIQAEMARGRTIPPVERWNPEHCGQIDLRIARDGTWFYLGTPIGRPALVRLFSTILRREADSSYVLVTPAERAQITVEDVPFMAVQSRFGEDSSGPTIDFLTNVGDWVALSASNPLRVETHSDTGEPRPYVLVRGRLEARLSRPVFYELVANAQSRIVAGSRVLGIESRGAFFALGADPEAEAAA